VFVPRADHVSAALELARYALHYNRPSDTGYVRYLIAIAETVLQVSPPHARVLDFGCGQHAVLAGILNARGVQCAAYDPAYEIGADTLAGEYDTIVLCEVVEHLRDIPCELERVRRALAPHGAVYVRTSLRPAQLDALAAWHYAQDPTHINFFSRDALSCAARMLGRRVNWCNGLDSALFTV
jgi:2-polyprenyl-3-methyl-5-hydroxy-6-metoxy-1,4-benzoquinol methylase